MAVPIMSEVLLNVTLFGYDKDNPSWLVMVDNPSFSLPMADNDGVVSSLESMRVYMCRTYLSADSVRTVVIWWNPHTPTDCWLTLTYALMLISLRFFWLRWGYESEYVLCLWQPLAATWTWEPGSLTSNLAMNNESAVRCANPASTQSLLCFMSEAWIGK